MDRKHTLLILFFLLSAFSLAACHAASGPPEQQSEAPEILYEIGTFEVGTKELPLPVPAPGSVAGQDLWVLQCSSDQNPTITSSQGQYLELDPLEDPIGDLPVYKIERYRLDTRSPDCTFTVTLACADWVQVDLHGGDGYVALLHDAPLYQVYSASMETLRLYADGNVEIEADNPTREDYGILFHESSLHSNLQGVTRLEFSRSGPYHYVDITSDTTDWTYSSLGFDSEPLAFTAPARHCITS